MPPIDELAYGVAFTFDDGPRPESTHLVVEAVVRSVFRLAGRRPELLGLLREARIYRPQLAARFVLNRCGARTVGAREQRRGVRQRNTLRGRRPRD